MSLRWAKLLGLGAPTQLHHAGEIDVRRVTRPGDPASPEDRGHDR